MSARLLSIKNLKNLENLKKLKPNGLTEKCRTIGFNFFKFSNFSNFFKFSMNNTYFCKRIVVT